MPAQSLRRTEPCSTSAELPIPKRQVAKARETGGLSPFCKILLFCWLIMYIHMKQLWANKLQHCTTGQWIFLCSCWVAKAILSSQGDVFGCLTECCELMLCNDYLQYYLCPKKILMKFVKILTWDWVYIFSPKGYIWKEQTWCIHSQSFKHQEQSFLISLSK